MLMNDSLTAIVRVAISITSRARVAISITARARGSPTASAAITGIVHSFNTTCQRNMGIVLVECKM